MPWGRIDDTLYDHPKLDDLPSDPEAVTAILETIPPEALLRLAALGLWARTISWSNRFLTDGDIPRGKVGRLDGSPQLADALVAVDLFETRSGGYAVHDFLHFNDSRADVLQRRQKEAERKAEWRRSRRDKKRPSGTSGGTDEPATHDVPQGVPVGQGDDVSRDVSQRDTRARVRSANPDPTRPDPTRPTESLQRDSARANGREDVQALRDRGWKRVTAAQRAVLDEVLARHDVTGTAFAAEVIRATPPEADPLEAVMAADRLWQDSQRRRADQGDLDWKATKEQEKREAGERLGDIEAGVDAWR